MKDNKLNALKLEKMLIDKQKKVKVWRNIRRVAAIIVLITIASTGYLKNAIGRNLILVFLILLIVIIEIDSIYYKILDKSLTEEETYNATHILNMIKYDNPSVQLDEKDNQYTLTAKKEYKNMLLTFNEDNWHNDNDIYLEYKTDDGRLGFYYVTDTRELEELNDKKVDFTEEVVVKFTEDDIVCTELKQTM